MSLIFLSLLGYLRDPLAPLRDRASDCLRELHLAWDLLHAEWRDKPPTPEEIRAHARTHPMWGPSALWVVALPTDQTVMVEYVYLGHWNPTSDAEVIADLQRQGAWLWRPCRILGEPCPWPVLDNRNLWDRLFA